MTTSKNRFTLDFGEQPDLQAALGGLKPGDRCTISLEMMVVSCDTKKFEGDIENVEYETGSEEAGEVESGSAAPTTEEPILAVIAKRNAKTKPAPKPEAKAEADEDEE